MKFINYLESITGIGIFPLMSLVIFVAFFTVVLLYVIKMDKARIDEVSRIPLDTDADTSKGRQQITD
jgi:hypothetical protein